VDDSTEERGPLHDVAGDRNPLSVPPVQTHLIASRHVSQTFRVQVMLPGLRKGDERRFPVVYATDGNWTFDMFKSISYLLQGSAEGDAPPFILVGIGYPGDSPYAGGILRARDFTAPPYPTWGDEWLEQRRAESDWEGVLLPEEGTRNHHGGADFRNFIEEELIPLIDENYPTVPGDRTYFGHSGGGFFGLYTLCTRPSMFKNYIVSSPGVIYHGEAPGGVHYDNDEFGLRMVRDFAASGPSLDGTRLYLSAGAEEEYEPAVANWRLTSSLERLAGVFGETAIPGLEVMTEIIPAEGHITVWPVAFVHGVQAVFGTRRVVRSLYP
jgi:uncharacterized protein